MNYGTLVMYDGSKVLIEVDDSEREGVRLSEKGIVHDLKEEFQLAAARSPHRLRGE